LGGVEEGGVDHGRGFADAVDGDRGVQESESKAPPALRATSPLRGEEF
jgi:hypothetical protein